jgi:hypothetical protein
VVSLVPFFKCGQNLQLVCLLVGKTHIQEELNISQHLALHTSDNKATKEWISLYVGQQGLTFNCYTVQNFIMLDTECHALKVTNIQKKKIPYTKQRMCWNICKSL